MSNNELFVSHLNYEVTEHELREIFGQWGEIDKVHILRDKQTNKSRGIGFVSYINRNSCHDAIKFANNMTLRDMKITVNFSNNSRGQKNNNFNNFNNRRKWGNNGGNNNRRFPGQENYNRVPPPNYYGGQQFCQPTFGMNQGFGNQGFGRQFGSGNGGNNGNGFIKFDNRDDAFRESGILPGDSNTVFVNNLPSNNESMDIKSILEEALGYTCFNFRKKNNYCFMSFRNRWKMYNAIKLLDGMELGDSKIIVKVAKRPMNRQLVEEFRRNLETLLGKKCQLDDTDLFIFEKSYRSLFVGNLSSFIKRADIVRYFRKYGDMLDANIIKTDENKSSYAFVVFSTIHECNNAFRQLIVHPPTINGMKVNIQLSKPPMKLLNQVQSLGLTDNEGNATPLLTQILERTYPNKPKLMPLQPMQPPITMGPQVPMQPIQHQQQATYQTSVMRQPLQQLQPMQPMQPMHQIQQPMVLSQSQTPMNSVPSSMPGMSLSQSQTPYQSMPNSVPIQPVVPVQQQVPVPVQHTHAHAHPQQHPSQVQVPVQDQQRQVSGQRPPYYTTYSSTSNNIVFINKSLDKQHQNQTTHRNIHPERKQKINYPIQPPMKLQPPAPIGAPQQNVQQPQNYKLNYGPFKPNDNKNNFHAVTNGFKPY